MIDADNIDVVKDTNLQQVAGPALTNLLQIIPTAGKKAIDCILKGTMPGSEGATREISWDAMRKTLTAFVSLLAIAVSAVHGQTAQAQSATAPADQACDAQKLRTNDYETCLEKAQAAIDKQLTALIASIPASAKVKTDILGAEVTASARKRWQTNFATLASTFRAARKADCDDDSIAEMGYGNGGLQWRLACEINETSREIDKLKKRYGLNS